MSGTGFLQNSTCFASFKLSLPWFGKRVAPDVVEKLSSISHDFGHVVAYPARNH
jgi:hypothetical protein